MVARWPQELPTSLFLVQIEQIETACTLDISSSSSETESP